MRNVYSVVVWRKNSEFVYGIASTFSLLLLYKGVKNIYSWVARVWELGVQYCCFDSRWWYTKHLCSFHKNFHRHISCLILNAIHLKLHFLACYFSLKICTVMIWWENLCKYCNAVFASSSVQCALSNMTIIFQNPH